MHQDKGMFSNNIILVFKQKRVVNLEVMKQINKKARQTRKIGVIQNVNILNDQHQQWILSERIIKSKNGLIFRMSYNVSLSATYSGGYFCEI